MNKCINCGWEGEELNGDKCPVCGDSRIEQIGDKAKVKDNFDLNNDGVVDGKDAKIAGQVLASRRKRKKK